MDHHAVEERACRHRRLTANDLRVESRGLLGSARPRIVLRGQMQELAVVARDDGVLAAAQAAGASHDRVENRLDVGRRARDDAQDLGGGRLLLERFGQLARALVDLALEAGVRLLELRGHLVELVAQRLQLVAGPDVDPLVELARADPRGADLQRLDGRDHAPDEQQARPDRQQYAQHQQDDRALDRVVEGRQRLVERLLHEHRPPQGRDRGVGGHHAPVLEVARDRDLLAPLRGRRRTGEGALDLVEPGERRVLQHEAHVRMRDQDTLTVDDEDMAGLADLDLGHDVPDELQIDVGHGDAGALAAPGDGDRHVRLGPLPEVDRAVVDAPGLGLEELGLARKIGLAADDLHRETGHALLLPAYAVEVAHLGDGQRLPLEPEVVDPPLRHAGRGSAEVGLDREPDLPLDLRDEGLDPRRHAERLLALERDERLPVLQVGEVDLETARRQQDTDHQPRKHDDVLAEEAAAGRHASVTASTASSGQDGQQASHGFLEAALDLVAARAEHVLALRGRIFDVAVLAAELP